MAQITPGMPRLYQPPGTNLPFVQKNRLAEAAAQSWLAMSLVQIAASGGNQTLIVAPAAATVVYGLAPSAAAGTGGVLTPPDNLFRGTNPVTGTAAKIHFPFDLRDVILEMTLSNGSLSGANLGANGVTYAGGGTNGVAIVVGAQYGLVTLTSGTYNKYQFVDVQNTTQKVFEIVGLAPSAYGVAQTVTDNNPRVLVKVIPAALQG